MKNNIHFANISDVSTLIETKEISPVELTQHLLSRIESIDRKLKSYVTVFADRAIDEAKRAEKEILVGDYRGKLHGIPLSAKDLCYTKGIRTMGGLKVRKDFIPSFDATVIKRLSLAGAILLGKNALTEGALSGYNPEFEIPINPWGHKLWAGVSSSGSGVAVAAGLCFGSLGTDTGGSIRYPSMANGIVGLKPSYGAISRYGVMELAGSLDHVGPMTRSVEDAANGAESEHSGRIARVGVMLAAAGGGARGRGGCCARGRRWEFGRSFGRALPRASLPCRAPRATGTAPRNAA